MDLGCEFCTLNCGSIIGSTLDACFGLCLRIPEEFVGGGLGTFYDGITKLIMGLMMG